jgi:GNAT superfamily N-acetyltransferase
MAIARSWPPHARLEGPYHVALEDLAMLNQVFSEAFTERYRRDGMVGVRVPFLHKAIWRYAIADAGDGAMLWRDGRGEIAAFNIAHASGAEGWMGPLAVHPNHQGSGHGKQVVRAGIAWLEGRGVRTIGLETMPRTMDNIGFYSALGFEPGRLTLTVTLDAAPSSDEPAHLLGRLPSAEQEERLAECRALVGGLLPGYDFTREIRLTHELSLGDVLLLRSGTALTGFALCHTVPLVEGRSRDELRVLKLVLASPDQIAPMLRALTDYARRSGTRRVALRVQGEYAALYRALVAAGARVRWTDLRLTLVDYPERRADPGIVLSNWEI